MVEVLVAILLLSFGLLALLSLMWNSFRISSTTAYRNVAVVQAQALSDVLRSNPASLIFLKTKLSNMNTSSQVSASCFSTSGCSFDDMVIAEVLLWKAQAESLLPSPVINFCQYPVPPGVANNFSSLPEPVRNGSISTSWSCSGSGATVNDPFVVEICWDESRLGITATTSNPPSAGSTNRRLSCHYAAV